MNSVHTDADRLPGAAAPKGAIRIVKRILGGIVAVALSATLIGSAFFRPSFDGGLHLVSRFPLGEWFASLPNHLWWVILFGIFSAAMAPLRALRWGFTLPKPKPAYSDRYHSVAIGLLGNNVIPGKFGEALRAMALTRFTEKRGRPTTFALSLGTIIVCKVLDLVALLVLVVLSQSGPFFGGATDFGASLTGVAVAVPTFVAALFLGARYVPRLADFLERKDKHPKLRNVLREFAVGVAASGSPIRVGLAFAGTLLAIATVATGYTIALYGAGVQAGIFSGVVLLAAVTLGQSPPGVPAGLGMYYLSCTWASRLLGATPEQAATLAVLTHLMTVISHLTAGAVSVVIRRVKVRDLLPRGVVKKQAASS